VTSAAARRAAHERAAAWQRLADADLSELRSQTPEQNFAALARLVQLARQMDWHNDDPAEEDRVREMWAEYRRRASRS
jgi:hypothetical protein